MPPAFTYEPLQDASFEHALLAVAFPSPGFVSQVAAHHLIQSQKLPLVGAFQSDDMPVAVAVRDGRPLPPLRIHVGQQSCGLDGSCDALATLVGDVVPPENLRSALARGILDWAEASGVGCIVALESMPLSKKDSEDGPRVSCVTQSDDARERLAKAGVEHLDGVLVSGMTAALLAQSMKRDIEVVGLFVEAHSSFRDAAAAAKLVEIVDQLLLGIPIDAEPLRQQAEELTGRLKQTADRTQAAFPYLSMYG